MKICFLIMFFLALSCTTDHKYRNPGLDLGEPVALASCTDKSFGSTCEEYHNLRAPKVTKQGCEIFSGKWVEGEKCPQKNRLFGCKKAENISWYNFDPTDKEILPSCDGEYVEDEANIGILDGRTTSGAIQLGKTDSCEGSDVAGGYSTATVRCETLEIVYVKAGEACPEGLHPEIRGLLGLPQESCSRTNAAQELDLSELKPCAKGDEFFQGRPQEGKDGVFTIKFSCNCSSNRQEKKDSHKSYVGTCD